MTGPWEPDFDMLVDLGQNLASQDRADSSDCWLGAPTSQILAEFRDGVQAGHWEQTRPGSLPLGGIVQQDSMNFNSGREPLHTADWIGDIPIDINKELPVVPIIEHGTTTTKTPLGTQHAVLNDTSFYSNALFKGSGPGLSVDSQKASAANGFLPQDQISRTQPNSSTPSGLDPNLTLAATETPSSTVINPDINPQNCIACNQGQYVNENGLCMVCQHYRDSEARNIWQPRFGNPADFLSRNSSSSSLGSVGSSRSVESTTSTNSKRGKRVLGGYPCTHHGCLKVFDVPSQLRHHRRPHTAKEDYRHSCHCGERFLYPKDLRRHVTNVHKEAGSVEGSTPQQPPAVPVVHENQAQDAVPGPVESRKGRKRGADSPPATTSVNHTLMSNMTFNELKTRILDVTEDAEFFRREYNQLGNTYIGTSRSHAFQELEQSPFKSGRQNLIQRSRHWLALIDELLFWKKEKKDAKTADAIAHLSEELDGLYVASPSD